MTAGKIGAVVVGAGLVFGLITAPFFMEKVPEGHVGVVYTPSGGASKIITPGFKFVGLFNGVTELPIRTQTIKTTLSVSTNDGKKIKMSATYNYKVVNDKKSVLHLFKEQGAQTPEELEKGYLYSKLYKAARETISQYSLMDIYGEKTTEASAKVTKDFAAMVEDMGFEVSDVTLGAPDADPTTQAAIDSRIQASQETEKKKIELENEKIEAVKKKTVAQGDADAQLIRAKGEADANREIQNSITEQVLRNKEMEARLKFGWVEVNGASGVNINK